MNGHDSHDNVHYFYHDVDFHLHFQALLHLFVFQFYFSSFCSPALIFSFAPHRMKIHRHGPLFLLLLSRRQHHAAVMLGVHDSTHGHLPSHIVAFLGMDTEECHLGQGNEGAVEEEFHLQSELPWHVVEEVDRVVVAAASAVAYSKGTFAALAGDYNKVKKVDQEFQQLASGA